MQHTCGYGSANQSQLTHTHTDNTCTLAQHTRLIKRMRRNSSDSTVSRRAIKCKFDIDIDNTYDIHIKIDCSLGAGR